MGWPPGFAGKRDHGQRDRDDALHRHGGHAAGCPATTVIAARVA
jgi:hypothetical protein